MLIFSFRGMQDPPKYTFGRRPKVPAARSASAQPQDPRKYFRATPESALGQKSIFGRRPRVTHDPQSTQETHKSSLIISPPYSIQLYCIQP